MEYTTDNDAEFEEYCVRPVQKVRFSQAVGDVYVFDVYNSGEHIGQVFFNVSNGKYKATLNILEGELSSILLRIKEIVAFIKKSGR